MDAAHIPNFQRMLRKRSPEPEPQNFWMRFAVAATLILAAVFSVNIHQKNRAHAEAEQWATLSQWSATTDGMLATSVPSISDTFTTDLLFDFSSPTSTTNTNL